MISVRKAHQDDMPGIWRVHASSVRVLCTSHYSAEQIEAWVGKMIPERYHPTMPASRVIFVAQDDSQLIGFSTLDGDTIRAVYVDPGYTGRGVGRRLLAALEKEAISRNSDILRLDASLNSVGFYEAAGYDFVEDGLHSVMGSDVQIPCARMEKRLLPQSSESSR